MSSNLNDGHRGLSHQSHQQQYFQQHSSFANFDPALGGGIHDNNADVAGGGDGDLWPYQPGQLGLAQPQIDHSHHHGAPQPGPSRPLYSQHVEWPNQNSLHQFSHDSQPDLRPGYFGNSYDTSISNSPSNFQNPTFANQHEYGAGPHPHHQQGQPFPHDNAAPGVSYNVHNLPYPGFPESGQPTAGNLGTIAPQDLQQSNQKLSAEALSKASNVSDANNRPSVASQHMHSPLPPGVATGNFVVTSADDLESVSKSLRLHNFVHVGAEAENVTISKSTIPQYLPRKSRNEIARLLASDSTLKAKVDKKRGKKGVGPAAKQTTPRIAVPVPTKVVSETKRQASPGSSQDESDDDESESSSEEEESILPPLPPTRPSKPVEAVKYDTIKALWRVPYRSALGDDIRKGLADFWEVIKTIRERWKSDAAAVKQAEEAKKVNELPLLKERVANQRDMLETSLRAALAEGHKDIIEHFGENLPLMNALAVTLQDRAKDGDYNGTLSKAVLEMLSCCKTLTDGSLEKTGIGKIVPRFAKRGDDSIKAFSKKITDNAAAASKKRKEASKVAQAVGSVSKPAKSDTHPAPSPGSPIAGTKRPREGETRNAQPTKKVAGTAASGASNSTDSSASAAKKNSVSTESKAAPPTSTTAAKKVVAKPTNFFSSLQPAYKKSTTPGASSAPAQQKAVVSSHLEKKATTAPTPAVATSTGGGLPPKPSFSFAETMANLTKPKEVEATTNKREENAITETAEEKAKRLRKEQRRNLRVSFKPDGELVDVRYFVHDPDEEQGHDASQVRDVGDLESEGRMFKLQHQEDQERMDLDEDEDDVDDEGTNSDIREYVTPSLIDFSDIPEDERSRNYIPYGGGMVEAESPEAQAQKQHEADTLLVVYSQVSDIPPNPKEPTETLQDVASPPKSFGQPPTITTSRLGNAQEGTSTAPSSSLPISSAELSALIGSLSQQAQQAQPPPVPNFPQPSELEKIVAQFSSQSPPQQQSQTFNPQQFSTPPAYYGGHPASTGGVNSQNISNQHNPAAVDVSALLASLQSAVPTAPNTSNIGDILGSLSSLGQQPYQQPQGVSQTQQQSNQAPPQQQQQYPYENEERRRWREGATTDSGPQKSWQSKKQRDPNRPTPMFVLPCKYFKEGKCIKGANCTYRHDMVD